MDREGKRAVRPRGEASKGRAYLTGFILLLDWAVLSPNFAKSLCGYFKVA